MTNLNLNGEQHFSSCPAINFFFISTYRHVFKLNNSHHGDWFWASGVFFFLFVLPIDKCSCGEIEELLCIINFKFLSFGCN